MAPRTARVSTAIVVVSRRLHVPTVRSTASSVASRTSSTVHCAAAVDRGHSSRTAPSRTRADSRLLAQASPVPPTGRSVQASAPVRSW